MKFILELSFASRSLELNNQIAESVQDSSINNYRMNFTQNFKFIQYLQQKGTYSLVKLATPIRKQGQMPIELGLTPTVRFTERSVSPCKSFLDFLDFFLGFLGFLGLQLISAIKKIKKIANFIFFINEQKLRLIGAPNIAQDLIANLKPWFDGYAGYAIICSLK